MQLSLDSESISYSLLKRKSSSVTNTESSYESLIAHNLDKYYHPASILKLFTAVILEDQYLGGASMMDLKDIKKIESERSLRKALIASIQDSDNDALAYIIDVLSPFKADYNFLAENDLEDLVLERQSINLFFQSRGFSSQINVANKCFGFDYYGKEEQLLERLGVNKITAQDLIDLLVMIEAAYPKTFKAMHRKLSLENAASEDTKKEIPSSIINTQDYQIESFAGKLIRNKLQIKEIYSKAGWTSKVRHDAVIFDYQDARYILIVMTEGFSNSPELLQKLAEFMLKDLETP